MRPLELAAALREAGHLFREHPHLHTKGAYARDARGREVFIDSYESVDLDRACSVCAVGLMSVVTGEPVDPICDALDVWDLGLTVLSDRVGPRVWRHMLEEADRIERCVVNDQRRYEAAEIEAQMREDAARVDGDMIGQHPGGDL